jgi:hypothetical protein
LCPSNSRLRGIEWRQNGFDFFAAWFKKRWKLQIATQRIERFIDREARLVSCNFKENPAGFVEIDRPKILAIDLLGRPKAMVRDELVRHLRLSRVICGAECDVMNRALAKPAGKKPLRLAYVDVAADRFTGTEANKLTVFAGLVESRGRRSAPSGEASIAACNASVTGTSTSVPVLRCTMYK